MALIIVKTDDVPETRDYFDGVEKNLHSPNFFQNPFTGGVRLEKAGEDLLSVIVIEPIYPPIWWGGLLLIGVCLVFPTPWLSVPGGLIYSLGIFWNPFFYLIILRKGLRKKGYNGKIKFLFPSKAWRMLVGSN